MQPLSEPADPIRSESLTSEPSYLPSEKPRYRWYHKLAAVTAALFCFELGCFLLVYPWVHEWDVNASIIPPSLRPFWLDASFRGAISGLGLLNIYISFTEVFRFRRFSSPPSRSSAD